MGVNAPEFVHFHWTSTLMRQRSVANIRHRRIWYGGYQFLPGERRWNPAQPETAQTVREKEEGGEKNTFPSPIS